jgi:teichuronic acid exporter
LFVALTDAITVRVRRALAASHYLRDILLQASGNTAAQFLAIAAMPLLTRLYSPIDFAAFNLFSQLVAGLAILMTLRFEYLVMLPADQNESDRILGCTFWLGVFHVIWLTPLLAVLPLHWTWLQSQGITVDWLWLAPITAWLLSMAVGLQQSIQRRGDFSTSAKSEFFGRCIYVAFALIGALGLPNIIGLMGSNLANGMGKILILIKKVDVFKISFGINYKTIEKNIRRMAWSISTSNLIALISVILPMVFIDNNYGSEALGQYGLVVSTLYLPATLIGQAIGQVYYQRACQLQNNGITFESLILRTTIHLTLIGVPLYSIIAYFSSSAYPLIFGKNWILAGEIASWLCIAAVACFISTPFDRTSIVVNAWWYLICWHSIRALTTCLVLWWVATNNIGFVGCVAALSVNNAMIYIADYLASYLFGKSSGKPIN